MSILVAILLWLASLAQPVIPQCDDVERSIAAHKLGQRIADAETQPVVVIR